MASPISLFFYSEEAIATNMTPPASNSDFFCQASKLLALVHGQILPKVVLGYFFVYAVFVLIKYRHTSISAIPRSDLAGPKGYPLIGNTIEMAHRPQGSTYQRQMGLHKEYGKTFALTVLGMGRVIHVCDPQMVDHVLRVNFWAYEKGSFFRETLRPIFGDGIFSADGHVKYPSAQCFYG